MSSAFTAEDISFWTNTNGELLDTVFARECWEKAVINSYSVHEKYRIRNEISKNKYKVL